MRADPTAQAGTLELAGIDAELGRLDHQRRTLPEHAELEAAEGHVQEAKDAVVRAETRAGDLDRDIRRIERDVEGVRARTEKDKSLLAGSGIGAKQATELQHELDTLARRQGVLEDEQLEIMEEREAVGGDLDHARATLSEAEKPCRRDRAPRLRRRRPGRRPGRAGTATARRPSGSCPPTCWPTTSACAARGRSRPGRWTGRAAAPAVSSWTARSCRASAGSTSRRSCTARSAARSWCVGAAR